jgi:hypothetical protein
VKENAMKEVEKKDLPEIPGGIRNLPGDGALPPGQLFPDFPRQPPVPYIPLPNEPIL